MWSVEGGAWDIVYVKKKKTRLHGSCASFSHTVVETQVSSKKGLCVQQREVNDAAMVLHSVYKARMFM